MRCVASALWVASDYEVPKISAWILTVTIQQYDAVCTAKHLPDVLKQVLDKAGTKRERSLLHLTYEEATCVTLTAGVAGTCTQPARAARVASS